MQKTSDMMEIKWIGSSTRNEAEVKDNEIMESKIKMIEI